MKSTTSTAPSSSRNSFYSKKPSPASINKRKESPLLDAIRRTPSELISSELSQLSSAQTETATREIQSLLEPDYRDDIKTYMFEMEVSFFPSSPAVLKKKKKSETTLTTFYFSYPFFLLPL